MVTSIVIGTCIFGYAGWQMVKHVKKSKEGKCSSCNIKSTCAQSCNEME